MNELTPKCPDYDRRSVRYVLDNNERIVGQNRIIINFVLDKNNNGEYATSKEIVEHLYKDRRDGGPVTAPRTIYVKIVNINLHLAWFGWRLKGRRGRGYCFVPINSDEDR